MAKYGAVSEDWPEGTVVLYVKILILSYIFL